MMDDDLKKMIVVNSDNLTAKKAINIASRTEREDILVIAMDNPNWDIKKDAVKAIGQLPRQKASGALISILKMDRLWIPIKGGEGKIVQGNFLAAAQDAVHNALGINVSAFNLFEIDQRKKIIAILEQ